MASITAQSGAMACLILSVPSESFPRMAYAAEPLVPAFGAVGCAF